MQNSDPTHAAELRRRAALESPALEMPVTVHFRFDTDRKDGSGHPRTTWPDDGRLARAHLHFHHGPLAGCRLTGITVHRSRVPGRPGWIVFENDDANPNGVALHDADAASPWPLRRVREWIAEEFLAFCHAAAIAQDRTPNAKVRR